MNARAIFTAALLLAIGFAWMSFDSKVEGATSAVSFGPVADAYVYQSRPLTNYGKGLTLRTDASPVLRSYLRFDVQGLSSPVTKATLRLYASSTSSAGIQLYAIGDNTWGERTINYQNAPPLAGLIASAAPIQSGSWISLDVTSYINGNGLRSLALVGLNGDAISFRSRESAANKPQLLLETLAPTPTPFPSASPTPIVIPTPTVIPTPGGDSGSVLWGAEISGTEYGLTSNPPWDMTAVDIFESHAQKKISILHWGTSWYHSRNWPQGYYPFMTSLFEAVRQRGYLSLFSWASWDGDAGGSLNQPAYSLGAIINGNHDTYITNWAKAAKSWGYPLFLRLDWEMNGNWFPWSEQLNGNSAGQYVRAWRHVHDIFAQAGATNVSWVWCPNTEYPGSIPLSQLYPGDAYVDWTCIDGYNWNDPWLSFSGIFTQTYNSLQVLAPTKPVMIGETSSTETGGSKSGWITDALGTQIPSNFKRIGAVVWFNWNTDGMDWVIESSPSAQSAFANALKSSVYTTNSFTNFTTSPIPARR